ncbi:hypothetical protein [Acinetobacter sp. ANC 4779]|nr:hypothetical protein [Acinetobacter sp. ANC 4779]
MILLNNAIEVLTRYTNKLGRIMPWHRPFQFLYAVAIRNWLEMHK